MDYSTTNYKTNDTTPRFPWLPPQYPWKAYSQKFLVSIYLDRTSHKNIFHTKMLLKEIDLKNYLFRGSEEQLSPAQRQEIVDSLRKEMIEIFNGRNIY